MRRIIEPPIPIPPIRLPVELIAGASIIFAIIFAIIFFDKNKPVEQENTGSHKTNPIEPGPNKQEPEFDPEPKDPLVKIEERGQESEPRISPKQPQRPDPDENCKNSEALLALHELTEKSIKIQSEVQGEVKRRSKESSKEWDEVYKKSIPEPMKIAVQTHCEIVQKNNRTNKYTKENVKNFIREYLKALNKMMPEVEKVSGSVIKLTINNITLELNKKTYTVSANMNEILAAYIEEGVLNRLKMKFEGDLSLYLIALFEHQPYFSMKDTMASTLDDHVSKKANVKAKFN